MLPQERGFERIFETTRFSGENMVYCNECERKKEATSVSFQTSTVAWTNVFRDSSDSPSRILQAVWFRFFTSAFLKWLWSMLQQSRPETRKEVWWHTCATQQFAQGSISIRGTHEELRWLVKPSEKLQWFGQNWKNCNFLQGLKLMLNIFVYNCS